MKSLNIFVLLISVLLLTALASAEVTQINRVYYGTVNDDGSLSTTTTPITNFNVLGFVCANSDCSSVTGTLWSGATLNSGANSQISLTYPTTLQQNGYGLYFYKDGYVPYEVKANWSGTGQASDGIRYLTRANNCQVPINHLIISHNGTNVTVSVTMDAGVSSPLQNAGPLNYIPSSIANIYAVNTVVDFRFIGPQNVSLHQSISLMPSESREVFASTTLAAGQYRIEVESNTNDNKCINSIPNLLSSNLLIENNRTNATLPLIAILSPQPTTYHNKTILVNIQTVNATSVLYNWNGTNVSYTGPIYISFNEGANTLNAFAINNVTTAIASVSFLVNTTLMNQTNQSDTTSPASISNLHLVSRGTSFLNWEWVNPGDSDFSQAMVYLDGMNVVNTSNNFYTAPNLVQNSTHTITINTIDFSGNINLLNISDSEMTLALNQSGNQTNHTTTHHNSGTSTPFKFPAPYIANKTIVPAEEESNPIVLTKAKSSGISTLVLVMLIFLVLNIILLIGVLLIAANKSKRKI